MPSIAQTILDKYNGVVNTAQSTITEAPGKVIARGSKLMHLPLTEEQLRAKDTIRNALRKGIWVIHFNKVDGTPAVMEATLDHDLLPSQSPTAGTEKPRAPLPEHLLAVYAVDRQGWRSFATTNITKMEPKL